MSPHQIEKTIPRSISFKRLAFPIVVFFIALSLGVYFNKPISQTVAMITPTTQPADHADHDDSTSQFYTCGMHPWVILPNPGDCPICFMALTPMDPSKFAGEIAIDPTIIQSMGVRTAPVTTGPLVQTISTVGTINYNETLVRDINIKLSGWIEKLHVDYLGAKVNQGDPLFEIYSPELYAAQEEYLIASHSIPQNVPLLDSARTRLSYYDITDTQIAALQKQNKPSKTLVIESPYTGVVIAKHANEGMHVNSGMQVYRIADLSRIWVIVTIYEYQLPYIKQGNKARMSLPYIPGHTFEGKITYIYPYLDKKTRDVQVRLEFENPDGLLKPGMFANVALENRLPNERTLAPREAIINTGKRKAAFVALGEGRFEPRQVITGIQTENGRIEIIQGLNAGEQVVTSGQFLLDSEANIRTALARMMPPAKETSEGTQPATSEPLQQLDPLTQQEREQLDPINQLIVAYLRIQDMLTRDDATHLAMENKHLQEAAKKIPLAADLLKVSELNKTDLKTTRQDFAALSDAMITLLKTFPKKTEFHYNLYQTYCPMVKKNWIQSTQSIRNPYAPFMLKCGQIKTQLAKESVPQTQTEVGQ